MADKKLIVVFGASGAQGGSVANAISKDPKYRLRLVSRKVDNPKFKEYIDKGAEVVSADQDDTASLVKALEGAYGCFIVTNFFTFMDGARETTQGINTVKAANQCGVQHIVFSGLENCKRRFNMEVPHFDSKGRVEDFLEENKYPFTSVRVAYYFENFVTILPPQKVAENTYVMNIPIGNTPLAAIALSDVGPCVLRVFNNRDKYLGKFIGLAGDELPVSKYAEILGKAFPEKTFSQSNITVEEYMKLPFPGADDIGAMFAMLATGKAIRSVADSKRLHPDMLDFHTWLTANKDKMAAALK